MADNGQDILTKETAEVQSYGELMGKENPSETLDLEPGKVELSIPQKITLDMYPQEEEEAVEAEPEVLATPVYQEAYVGEDGVELSVPPTYIKDNLSIMPPQYQRPQDMPEFMDDESYAVVKTEEQNVVVEKEETPDFLHEWTDDAPVQNQLPEEDDFEEPEMAADDEDYDLSNIDEIIAAHTPQEEKVEVKELSAEDIVGNGSPVEHDAIPRFEPDFDDEVEEVEVPDVRETEVVSLSESANEVEDIPVEEDIESEVVSEVEPEVVVRPTEVRKEEYAEDMQRSSAQFYTGQIDDGYLIVSAENMPEEFQADALVKAIMVNTGNSDYGWSVAFDNGVIMGIADVRRFQLRNGRLPAMDGILSYGNKRMRFGGVERIVVYEVPRYFGYK